MSEIFDTREFDNRMRVYSLKERVAAMRAITKNAMDLESKAKELAPKDDGNLEGDIMATEAVERGETIFAEVHAGTGNSRNYALRMHESMWPAIPANDRQFMPGPITEQRPGNEVGPAGGKYLQRPLMFYMRKYTERIADKLRAIR